MAQCFRFSGTGDRERGIERRGRFLLQIESIQCSTRIKLLNLNPMTEVIIIVGDWRGPRNPEGEASPCAGGNTGNDTIFRVGNLRWHLSSAGTGAKGEKIPATSEASPLSGQYELWLMIRRHRRKGSCIDRKESPTI